MHLRLLEWCELNYERGFIILQTMDTLVVGEIKVANTRWGLSCRGKRGFAGSKVLSYRT